jgi:hypothetical protein
LVVVGKLTLVGESKEIRRNESATRESQSSFDVYREYACESADRMQGIKEAWGDEDSAQDCKSVPVHAAGGNDRVVAKEQKGVRRTVCRWSFGIAPTISDLLW